MHGLLAIALLTAWAAPASAGFRYVPPARVSPAEVEAGAEPAAKGVGVGAREIEPRPGTGPGVSGTSVPGTSVAGTSVSGTSVWRVHAGEMLREALARWGARAGTDVVFLTDRRYRLEGDAAFQGGFADAAQALFEALSHLPHPPEGALSADGTSLAVTHRQAVPTETGGKP